MFEFAWPWIFLLAPLPWLLRALLPPADSGETISPGCAALAITTPANGARTTVLSTPWSAMRSCAPAT